MFKRLFLLSGIIAFFLACVMMYFWYLPNYAVETSVPIEQDSEVAVELSEPDSLNMDASME